MLTQREVGQHLLCKQEHAGCALVKNSPKPGTRAGPTTDPTVPPCVENQP